MSRSYGPTWSSKSASTSPGTVPDAGGTPPAGTAPDGAGRFFHRMAIDLRIDDVTRSYHVPLLLAPFGMTTYRGS